jgi:hypothetical protein
LPEVSQLLHHLCLLLVGRVVLNNHLPYPARDVDGFRKVDLSHHSQLLSVNVSLHKDRQPSILGIGGIGDDTKPIIDIKR